MAAGDISVFDAFKLANGQKAYHLGTDAIKLAFVDNTIVPTVSLASPHWGATGTDLSANEVSGGNFPVGGVTIANQSWAISTPYARLDGDDPAQFAADGANPSNIFWGIFYFSAVANNPAIAFMEIGSGISVQTIPLTVTFGANGIIRF